MCILHTFCCFWSLKFGTKLVGWINLVMCSTLFVATIIYFELFKRKDLPEKKSLLIMPGVIFLMKGTSYNMLIYAMYKENSKVLQISYCIIMFTILLGLIWMAIIIDEMSNDDDLYLMLILHCIFLVIEAYCMWVAISYLETKNNSEDVIS